jgi:hypothetical protein
MGLALVSAMEYTSVCAMTYNERRILLNVIEEKHRIENGTNKKEML